MIDDKPVEELTRDEIVEAINTPLQPPVNNIEESAEELKAMGIRDISDADEQDAMNEALKNVQLTKVLEDSARGQKDKKSIKDYLESHAKFLLSVSPGKTLGFIVQNITIEHARAVLKTTAKMDNIPEAVLKKHLKTLKKKYT